MTRLENLLGAYALTLTQRVADAGRTAGIAPSEQGALVTLLAHPNRTVTRLGEVLGLTSSGITRLVDRMVAAGWVTRTPGRDSRERTLRLTADGRAQADVVLRARHQALAASVDGLAPDDRAHLERLLDRLVGGLADSRSEALRACRLCDRSACRSGRAPCPLEHTATGDDADG